MQPLIPRLVHSAWFGPAVKPPLICRCQASWRQHLPDYEFREWSEKNFDVNACPFVAAAYRLKRWAFLTDYVRLKALYDYGGIYMDADVEVLRPLTRFLWHRAFTGHEADIYWLSATMGAEPRHPWIKMLLDHYERSTYIERANTQVVTELSQSWLEREEDGFRYLREGVVIYPTPYFTGYDHVALRPVVTEDSYTTHHFAGSWTNRCDPVAKPVPVRPTPGPTTPIIRTAQQLRRRA